MCDRCIAIGGTHDASRLVTAGIVEHRQLTESLLFNVRRVIAPSAAALDARATQLPRGRAGDTAAVAAE